VSNQAITLALQTQGVSSAEKFLLVVISNYANQDMEAWPSHARLARDTCMSRRTIIRLVASLAEKKLISVRGRKSRGLQTTSLYTLTFRGDMMAQRGDIDALDVVTSTTKPGDTMAHEPKKEPIIEPPYAREARAAEIAASRALGPIALVKIPRPKPPAETPAQMASRLRQMAMRA